MLKWITTIRCGGVVIGYLAKEATNKGTMTIEFYCGRGGHTPFDVVVVECPAGVVERISPSTMINGL